MKIRTNFDYPPIPVRDMDYSAVDDDTYDGAPDAGSRAQRIGHGRTAEDAVKNLAASWMLDWDDDDDADLDREETDAKARGDTTTLDFIAELRRQLA